MNNAQSQKNLLLYSLLGVSAIAYFELAYKVARENFFPLFSFYILLFAIYFVVYRIFSITHFKNLLIAGIIFRIMLLFSVPNLSDDVYRFIWDGRLAANGINPFSHLPVEVMQMPPVNGITNELFGQLNSPHYYTIYPPVLQSIFWLTAKLFPVNIFGAIILLKSFILLFELGTIYLLLKLLKKLALPKYLALLYIFNPLVIIELTGNVHFEGAMIFFVLLTFFLVLYNNWKTSSICLGLGIATKLIPVLFLPLLINKLGWKKGIMCASICCLTCLLLFATFFDLNTLQHLLKSVDLFFQRFEFNASIYYMVRWVGTIAKGYNIIAISGPVLSLLAASIISFISFRTRVISDQQFFRNALFIITTWYLFSTTVHPWYICLPVALSIFTTYRYPIVWSITSTLSYFAYQFNPVHENLWVVGVGYIFMIGYALWEIKIKRIILL